MTTAEQLAERVSEEWYSISPKYRTQEMLEHLVADAIRKALREVERG